MKHIPVVSRILAAPACLLLLASSLAAEFKVERDVRYGPDPRNVMDVYWKTEYKKAPIVFTIHGGGFKNGSKAYCNKDMQDLYMGKGCIVVSPNYRLMKQGSSVTPNDCVLDVAMAVAHMQANAGKFGGDANKIISTGSSAGGHISAQIAYRKKWIWPSEARHKPDKLNVVGWFGDSPGLPTEIIEQVGPGDPPGFVIYGGREHPKTPASQGHQIQAALQKHEVWSKMVYIAHMGHVPSRRILFSPRTRDRETHKAFSEFLDMVCYQKGMPGGGDVIRVKRK